MSTPTECPRHPGNRPVTATGGCEVCAEEFKDAAAFAQAITVKCPVCKADEGIHCKTSASVRVQVFHAQRTLAFLRRDKAMKATPWRLHDDSGSDGYQPGMDRWWLGRVNATGPYGISFFNEVHALNTLEALNDMEPYVAGAERYEERARLLQRTDSDGRSNWVGYWDKFESILSEMAGSTGVVFGDHRRSLRAHVEDRLAALAARMYDDRATHRVLLDAARDTTKRMEEVFETFGGLLGLNPTVDHPQVAVKRVRALRDIADAAREVIALDHASGLNGHDVRVAIPITLWERLVAAVMECPVVFDGSRPVMGVPPAHECLDRPAPTLGDILPTMAEAAEGLARLRSVVLWCDPGSEPRSAVPCGLDVSHAQRWPKE